MATEIIKGGIKRKEKTYKHITQTNGPIPSTDKKPNASRRQSMMPLKHPPRDVIQIP